MYPSLGPKPDQEDEKAKTKSVFMECLSEIALTAEGDGYGFTKLEIDREEITDIYDILTSYPNLRKINMMGNLIKDISTITTIPYLLNLDTSRNQIEDITCFTIDDKLQYL